MNTELLVKLMRMTTSNHDAEALVALRKANAMLAEAKMDWHDVLSGRVRAAPPRADNSYRTPPSQRQRSAQVDVKEMITYLLNTIPSHLSFYDYVVSVSHWYDVKGSLTEPQYVAIRRAYLREVNRRTR